MEALVKSDVAVVLFPYSDLSEMKKRPALVIATNEGNDHIFAQITSFNRFDSFAIELKDGAFQTGKLQQDSCIRINKLFTLDKSLIIYKIGSLKKEKMKEVTKELIKMVER